MPAPLGATDRKQAVRPVAFIGNTRAGKSTVINALLGTEDARVPAADQDGATTAGMRAFDWQWTPEKLKGSLKDATSKFADREKLSSSSSLELPAMSHSKAPRYVNDGHSALMQAMLAKQAKAAHNAPTVKALLLDTEGTDAARFVAPAEAGASGAVASGLARQTLMDKRNDTVERQLPRLAFICSNVLVLVTTSDLSRGSCFTWITDVARSAVAKVQRQDKPALVIVQNKAVDVSPSTPGDDGKARAERFFQCHDPDHDMLALFSELRVFVLPALNSPRQAFDRAVESLGDGLWQLAMHPTCPPAVTLSEVHWLRVFRSLVSAAGEGKKSQPLSFLDAMLAEQASSPYLTAVIKVYSTVLKTSFNALYSAFLVGHDGPGSAPASSTHVSIIIAFLETKLLLASARCAGLVLVASDRSCPAAELLAPLEVHIRDTFTCQAVHPDFNICHFCRKSCKAHGDMHEFSMSQLSKGERKAHKVNKRFFSMRKKLCWPALDGAVKPQVDLNLIEEVGTAMKSHGLTNLVETILAILGESLAMCKEELHSIGVIIGEGADTDMESLIQNKGGASNTLRTSLNRLLKLK